MDIIVGSKPSKKAMKGQKLIKDEEKDEGVYIVNRNVKVRKLGRLNM